MGINGKKYIYGAPGSRINQHTISCLYIIYYNVYLSAIVDLEVLEITVLSIRKKSYITDQR